MPSDPAFAALASIDEITTEVQKTLENLQKIGDQLVTNRSVVCIVDNVTNLELTYEGSHCESGGFAEPPPAVIPPLKSMAFSAQKASGSLAGVAGWVNYRSRYGERFFLHFDNPLSGANGSDAQLTAGDTGAFRASSITGNGNQRAQMRYILVQNHIPLGPIADKYAFLQGRDGFLGLPVTDISRCPDGEGFFMHFQGGSIYWTRATGAFEVHGRIRDKWATLGWETSFLGYPKTDETGTPDRLGRFNHFQGGSIYWSEKTGAHEVHGEIRTLWERMGWETGACGYPTSDEMEGELPGSRMNMFQHGQILWTPADGAKFYRTGTSPVLKLAVSRHLVA